MRRFPPLDRGLAFRTSRVVLSGVALVACTAGTEPSSNPRQLRTDSNGSGQVSGRVVTSGVTRSPDAGHGAEAAESPAGGWIEFGSVAGEPIEASQPLAGVVVELGIVYFARSGDSAATGGVARSVVVPMAVPDVWIGPAPRFLAPGPADPPGRFEVIARTTTDGRGEFRFSRAPRLEPLMLRARPLAPYEETYSHTPFWLASEPAKEVNVVLRARAR